MDCFTNLVGIKHDCGERPEGLIWLDNFTGIGIHSADKAHSPAYQSGMDLLTEKRSLAAQIVASDFRSHLNLFVRMKSIADGGTAGYYTKNLPVVTAKTGFYAGLLLEGGSAYPYAAARITSARLQATTTGTVPVKVYDLTTAKEIDTFDIETIADEISEVSLDKSYRSKGRKLSLAFVFDAGSTDTYRATFKPDGSLCSGCNGGYTNLLGNIRGKGIIINQTHPFINSNLKSTGHTSGLSLTYSLECEPEAFICEKRTLMAVPFAYKWAALVMEELRYSQRLNSIVTFKGDAKELQENYEYQYKKTMRDRLENMQMPNDICFGCKPRVWNETRLP